MGLAHSGRLFRRSADRSHEPYLPIRRSPANCRPNAAYHSAARDHRYSQLVGGCLHIPSHDALAAATVQEVPWPIAFAGFAALPALWRGAMRKSPQSGVSSAWFRWRLRPTVLSILVVMTAAWVIVCSDRVFSGHSVFVESGEDSLKLWDYDPNCCIGPSGPWISRWAVRDGVMLAAYWIPAFAMGLLVLHLQAYGLRSNWLFGCRACGYPTQALRQPQCPECGKPI